MECENCVYYQEVEREKYPRCVFRDYHDDYDVAPCDDRDYDEEEYSSDYYGD